MQLDDPVECASGDDIFSFAKFCIYCFYLWYDFFVHYALESQKKLATLT
jgi:hypothetical protein